MYDVAAKIFDDDNFIKNDPIRYAIKTGNHYQVLVSTTVAAASTTYLLVITPNTTVRQHLTMTAWSSAAITIKLYSGAVSVSTGVVSYTAYNNNRRSTNATSMSFMTVASSDLTSTGTAILETQTCLANNFVKFGGNDFVTREYILAQNTQYIFAYLAASTTGIISNYYFYED